MLGSGREAFRFARLVLTAWLHRGRRPPNVQLPEGEELRRAVRWVSDQRREDPAKKLATLVDEAAQRFDLSPLEAEWLWRALKSPDAQP